jgi:hypothetical protein
MEQRFLEKSPSMARLLGALSIKTQLEDVG